MNRVLMLIALVVFLGFLAILAVEVPSPDLLVVIALTAGLVVYDFWSSSRSG